MEDTLTTIETYLAAEMSEQDRLVFAERLAKEPDLQAQFTQYQDSRALLEQAVSLRLKKQMQQMQRPAAKVKPLANPWVRWSSLAASIVLLLAAGFWWTNRSANSYDDYFEAYALVNGLRGTENMADRWQEAYQRQDYPLAKGVLSQIKEHEAVWVEAQFYLGNIALAEAKPQEGIKPLQAVVDAQSVRYQTSAEWYLLLAFWGSEDFSSVEDLAKAILSDEQHPYYDRVKRLMQNLDRL